MNSNENELAPGSVSFYTVNTSYSLRVGFAYSTLYIVGNLLSLSRFRILICWARV